MNRDDILRYAGEQLGAGPEYLWAKSPTYFVLRHGNNRKWFAAVMDVPWAALGLSGEGRADILNIKCDPLLTGSLLEREGIFPAYHMNKSRWVSLLLDGPLPDEEIIGLLLISYDLTKGRR